MIEGISLLWLWAILVGAIIAIFRIMEDTATPDAKRKVADWIKSFATKSVSQTVVESPRWFIVAFDRIFGDRHLTLYCFGGSSFASIIAVVVMTFLWIIFDPTSWRSFLGSPPRYDKIFLILIIWELLNLVPDYISLLETRWILNRVEHAGLRELIILLILDAFITGGIFICGAAIVLMGIGDLPWESFKDFLMMAILFWTQETPPPGIFFYSTYFTSVWFYLFVASSIAAKLLYSLGRIGNWVMALLKVEEKPFQSMGLIVVGLLTLTFAISAIMCAIG